MCARKQRESRFQAELESNNLFESNNTVLGISLSGAGSIHDVTSRYQ
jgi:hypothetical protein